MRTATIIGLVLAIAITAHAQPSATTGPSITTQPAATSRPAQAAAPTLDPATEKLYTVWAKEVAQTVSQGRACVLEPAIDIDAILDKAIVALKLTADSRDETAAVKSLLRSGICTNFIEGMREGASRMVFLGLQWRDGQPTALFRLSQTDGTVDYRWMSLSTIDKGQVRVRDIFMGVEGFSISDQLSRVAELLLKGQIRSDSGTLDTLRDIYRLHRDGNYKDSLELFKALPPENRRERSTRVLQLVSAAHVGLAEFQPMMARYRKDYKDDFACDVMEFSALAMNRQYKELPALIGRLEKVVGSDPYLDAYKLWADVANGKTEGLAAKANAILKQEPDMPQALHLRVYAAVMEKNYREAARLLTDMETWMDMNVGDIGQDPLYADFAASARYKDWMVSRHKSVPAVK